MLPLGTRALLAFKPRQVILAEHNTSPKTKKTTSMTTTKSNRTLVLNAAHKAHLLHSVLRYLDRNAYAKTLKRFLSEAQIQNDDWKTCSLDLEILYCKHLETSTHADRIITSFKEQTLKIDGTTRKDEVGKPAASEECLENKKKKKSDKRNTNTASAYKKLTESVNNSEEMLGNDLVIESKVKLKEKKTSKITSDALGQTEQAKLQMLKTPAGHRESESPVDELTKKQKHEKTKNVVVSESSLGDDKHLKLESLQGITEEKSNGIACSVLATKTDYKAEVKSKDRKRKNKQSTDSLVANNGVCGLENKVGIVTGNLVSVVGGSDDVQLKERKIGSEDKKDGSVFETKTDAEKEISKDVVSSVPKSKTSYEPEVKPKDKKKKTKKSSDSPVETIEHSGLENKMGLITAKEGLKGSDANAEKEKKSSKKRKRLVSDETEDQSVKLEPFEESKRQKTEGSEEAKKKDQSEKGVGVKVSAKDSRQVVQNEPSKIFVEKLERLANGDLEKSGLEKTSINRLSEHANGTFGKNLENSMQKSSRKQHNGSAEPKTVNAFQRVKAGEVEFADQKLQDNSYWAKDGAEVGYGAKAQEVLGQVKGRDFRHEKTKKKRGSYRGGQIDLQSHSIKFNYSDED